MAALDPIDEQRVYELSKCMPLSRELIGAREQLLYAV